MTSKILIRFDDICPTMNWEQWDKAKQILDEVGSPALLGVIPDCQDPDLQIDEPKADFWKYIKGLQNQGFTIAMHGYQHVFDINAKGIVTKKHPTMDHSEFAGHSYDVQYRKIKAGKELLLKHGIETDTFFAPAHAYDENTLKALAANGFKYLSDGKSYLPYVRNGIICIPARTGGVPRKILPGINTIVLHVHEWVKKDKLQEFDELSSLCKRHQSELVSLEDLKTEIGNKYLQQLYEKIYLVWEQIVRPFLRNCSNKIKA